MRPKFFQLMLITLFAMLIMANSFHHHTSMASGVKCPSCSGMHVSANTHSSVKIPHVTQSEITALPPVPVNFAPIQNSISRFSRDRAPPALTSDFV